MSASCPYPGLRPFRHDEAGFFFGREEQAKRLRRALEERRFVAVIGTSGSGKSSLVRAGLFAELPAVQSGAWRIAELRPGRGPFAALGVALGRALDQERRALLDEDLDEERAAEEMAADTAYLQVMLRDSTLGIREVLVDTFHGAAAQPQGIATPVGFQLLIFVDQFEEIFRYRQEGAAIGQAAASAQMLQSEADAFVALLLRAVEDPALPVKVLLTMRSDYLGDCAIFQGLPEQIDSSQYLIPRLTREERRAAIVGPVRLAEGDIDPELTARLLNDSGPDQDQLPLLQHCLMRIWHAAARRPAPAREVATAAADGERSALRDVGEAVSFSMEAAMQKVAFELAAPWPDLTVADYVEMGALQSRGTDPNCLSKHAAEIVAELEQQGVARRTIEMLFRSLTHQASAGRDTRREITFLEALRIVGGREAAAELRRELALVVTSFAAEGRNFMVLQPPELSDATVLDISHESLQRNWDLLQDLWLPAEKRDAETYLTIVRAAEAWESAGRLEPLTGRTSREAQQWWNDFRPTPDWAGIYERRGKAQPGKEAGEAPSYRLAEEFLQASAEAERKRVKTEKFAKVAGWALVAAVVLLGILGVSQVILRGDVKNSRAATEEAELKRTVAEAGITAAMKMKLDAEAAATAAGKEKAAALEAAAAAKKEKETTARDTARAIAERASVAWENDELLDALALIDEARRYDSELNPRDFVAGEKYPPYVFESLLPVGEGVRDLTFDPNGRFLAVASDRSLSVYDLESGRDYPMELPEMKSSVYAFDATGQYLAVVSDGQLKVFDLRRDGKPAPLGLPELRSNVFAFVPGANAIAVALRSAVKVYDLTTGSEMTGSPLAVAGVAEESYEHDVTSLTIDGDGTREIVARPAKATLQQAGKSVSLPNQIDAYGAQFVDGRTGLISANYGGRLTLYDLKELNVGSLAGVRAYSVSDVQAGPAKFLPELLVVKDDGSVALAKTRSRNDWEVGTGWSPAHRKTSGYNPVRQVLSSGDGKYAIWSPAKGYLCVSSRPFERPQAKKRFEGQVAKPGDADYSARAETMIFRAGAELCGFRINPGNLTIATAERDGVVRFWRRVTEEEAERELAKNTPEIRALEALPEGGVMGFGVQNGRLTAVTSKGLRTGPATESEVVFASGSEVVFAGPGNSFAKWSATNDQVRYGWNANLYGMELTAISVRGGVMAGIPEREENRDDESGANSQPAPTVVLLDLLSGRILGRRELPAPASMFAFSPDGNRLVVLMPVEAIKTAERPPANPEAAPDAQKPAVGTKSGDADEEEEKFLVKAEIWDISDRAAPKPVRRVEGVLPFEPTELGWGQRQSNLVSADGTRILARLGDYTVILDLRGETIRAEPILHGVAALEGGGNRVAFSSEDGMTIAKVGEAKPGADELDDSIQPEDAWEGKASWGTFGVESGFYYVGDERTIYRRHQQKTETVVARQSWLTKPARELSLLAGCRVEGGKVVEIFGKLGRAAPQAAPAAREVEFWAARRALQSALAQSPPGLGRERDALAVLIEGLPEKNGLRERAVRERTNLLQPALGEKLERAFSFTAEKRPELTRTLHEILKLEPGFAPARVLLAYLEPGEVEVAGLAKISASERRELGENFFRAVEEAIRLRGGESSPEKGEKRRAQELEAHRGGRGFALWLLEQDFLAAEEVVEAFADAAEKLFGWGEYTDAASAAASALQYLKPELVSSSEYAKLLLLRGRALRAVRQPEAAAADFEAVVALEGGRLKDEKALAMAFLGRQPDGGELGAAMEISTKRILASVERDAKKRAQLSAKVVTELISYVGEVGADYLKRTKDFDELGKDPRVLKAAAAARPEEVPMMSDPPASRGPKWFSRDGR